MPTEAPPVPVTPAAASPGALPATGGALDDLQPTTLLALLLVLLGLGGAIAYDRRRLRA